MAANADEPANAEQARYWQSDAGRKWVELQESLDLRYPVYVVVTKCDLITGFREFFDAPGNESFEPQMLGWSNPDSLDHPFEPARTPALLAPIADRLQRVRDRLLGANWPTGSSRPPSTVTSPGWRPCSLMTWS